jgi:hypothetical protein
LYSTRIVDQAQQHNVPQIKQSRIWNVIGQMDGL